MEEFGDRRGEERRGEERRGEEKANRKEGGGLDWIRMEIHCIYIDVDSHLFDIEHQLGSTKIES